MNRVALVAAALATLGLAGCHGPSEPVYTLGAQRLSGYHILAGASTSLPGGDIGYLITANGQGDYSLRFTDTEDTAARFDATLSTDGAFVPSASAEPGTSAQFTAANQLVVSGIPGASVEGVDFSTQSEPVYFDLLVDGSHTGFGIYFTGAHTSEVIDSVFNPVAFTSP